MATVYKIEIKTVSPYIAYTEKDMNKIMLDLVKSYSKLNFNFESTEVKTEIVNTLDADRFITNYPHFAWLPVKTTNAGWVWLMNVIKTVDERPEVYLGLLPQTSYTLDKSNTYPL